MRRIISLAVLVAFIAGPAAADAQSTDYWSKYAAKLPIGSTVRVRTADGRRFTAVLAIVDDTGITVAPKTRRPEAPRHIPFDQLTQLELRLEGDGSVAKAAAIGVASGVGAFFGMLLILFATTSWD